MKPHLGLILFSALVLTGRAEARALLARFELKGLAVEQPVGAPLPSRSVVFYRSAVGAHPLEEYVEVKTIDSGKTTTRRLSIAAAGQLLDAFESAALPDLDYQKHFELLAKTPPEARRGMAWLPDGGGGRRVLIELHTNARRVRFEIWNPEVCFYSHPSDQPSRAVYRLIEACGYALGSGLVFLESLPEPNRLPQPAAP